MKLLNLDESPLMEITALEREGSNIVVKGAILGTMPVTCLLTPSEARKAFGLLKPKLFFFLLTFLFRS